MSIGRRLAGNWRNQSLVISLSYFLTLVVACIVALHSPLQAQDADAEQASVEQRLEIVDEVLQSKIVGRMMELVKENAELRAELKIQQAEFQAKMEVSEFKTAHLSERLERLQDEVNQRAKDTPERKRSEMPSSTQANQIGKELYELLTNAQDRLEKTYNELNRRSLELQKESPNIVWTTDGGRDPYAEDYQNIQAEISTTRVRRVRLLRLIEDVEAALNSGRSPEAVLFMMGGPLVEESEPLVSRKLEQETLLPMQMRERRLAETVGDGHPSIKTLREQIAQVEKQIDKIRTSEKRLAKEQGLGRPSVDDVQMQIDERLAAHREEVESLDKQIKSLNTLAEESKKKSNELQLVLGQYQLLSSEMKSVQALAEAFTKKIDQIEL